MNQAVTKWCILALLIIFIGVQSLCSDELPHRRAWMLAPPSAWAAHKPFGNNFERLPEGPLKEVFEAMREVDARFGPGAIVVFGGTVRDLMLGKTKTAGDIDIAVGQDLDRQAVFRALEEALGLPLGSITRQEAMFQRLFLDAIHARYYRGSRRVVMDHGISSVTLAFNSMVFTADGTFLDRFGGYKDLQEGRVRLVSREPGSLRGHVTMWSVLDALRWKHQLGFPFDPETQYIVRHYLNKQNPDPSFLPIRRQVEAWLRLVRWHRTFLRLKENRRWMDAYRHIERFPLFGKDYRSFPAETQKAVLTRLKRVKRGGGDKSAVEYFRRFIKRHKMAPQGIDVKLVLDRGKQFHRDDDADGIGRKVAELIKNAINPEAAAKELISCGFRPILAASGIRIEEVLRMRHRLQGVLHEGKSVTTDYLDDDEKRLLCAFAHVLSGKVPDAIAILKDVQTVPEPTVAIARAYLDARCQDALVHGAHDRMPLRKSMDAIADGLGDEPMLSDCYARACMRVDQDPLKQEAILNLACRLQEADAKDQLVRGMLEAFGLSNWVVVPHEAWLYRATESLRILAVRIPKPADSAKPPQGLEILWHELATTEEFFFLYDAQWRLIAVLPVVPMGKKFKNYSAKYLDLSPYYFDMPALHASDFKARWRDLAAQWKRDQEAIQEALPLIFIRYGETKLEPKRMDWDKSMYFATPFGSIHNLLGAAKPYVYAKFQIESPGKPGQDFPQDFVMFDPSEAEKLDIPKGEDTYSMIVPIPPTVYPPNDVQNVHGAGCDEKYYSAILPGWAGMEIKEGDIVCVKGPGSGLDFLLAAKRLNAAQTGRPIYVQDINPVSVAMIKELARREGISVITNVGSSLIGPDGQPVFGNVRFDKIIWNMPWFRTALSATGNVEFDKKWQAYELASWKKYSLRWDIDRGGEDLKRLLWEFPQLSREGGTAILWNRMGDVDPVALRLHQPGDEWPKRIVPKMIEDFGLCAQIFPSSSQDAVFIVTLPSRKDSQLPRSENAILTAL